MKMYKQTDASLDKLRVGDVLELNDGTKHKAVASIDENLYCDLCSIFSCEESKHHPIADNICCGLDPYFHFIKLDK